MTTRAEREKHASDETPVYKHWHRLQHRFAHVFNCPNSQRSYKTLEKVLQGRLAGARVLEIGCGGGAFAERLSQLGAAYVLATDISEVRIQEAKAREQAGVLEYAVADASVPISEKFDVIVGCAVLHHIDYREVISRLMRDNLKPGGLMLFYEPLASNPLMLLFRHFSKHAHTQDERAFDRHDLAWMRACCPEFSLIPFNFVSLPLGAISSFLFSSPDNALLRLADRVDWFLAQHVRPLHPYFRTAIFILPAR